MSQPKSQLDLDLLSINTIRTLAIDAVQQANSGHPGAPMGLAPVVYSLWQRFLRYDPADPTQPGRVVSGPAPRPPRTFFYEMKGEQILVKRVEPGGIA